ncbi:MAG: aminotransferase, partial [Cyclobacteriaceae bacterium]
MDKRSFLKNLGMLPIAGVPLWQSLDSLIKQTSNVPAEVLAKDEDFWEAIRGGYKIKPDYINLENGYYCFLPQEILEKQIDHIREVNYQGSYYMRTVQWDNKKKMAAKLAELAGCLPEELVITRNTTESL